MKTWKERYKEMEAEFKQLKREQEESKHLVVASTALVIENELLNNQLHEALKEIQHLKGSLCFGKLVEDDQESNKLGVTRPYRPYHHRGVIKLYTREPLRPPLGLKPRKLYQNERVGDIMAAIRRYSDARKPVPVEWVNELDSLTDY